MVLRGKERSEESLDFSFYNTYYKRMHTTNNYVGGRLRL